MAVTLNASTSTGYIQTADTSGDLALQSNGTTQFTVASTGAYGQLKSGTAVASTSGTSIDFTSIPSWVKRITVMLSGVSTSGTSIVQVQIGSGSVTTSGYTDAIGFFGNTNNTGLSTFSSGFAIPGSLAADNRYTVMTINNLSGNTWMCSGTSYNSAAPYTGLLSGAVSLSGTLDRVRITTVNGTDTFDAGTINILYEG